MNYKTKHLGTILLIIVSIFLALAAFGYYFILPGAIDFDKYKEQIRTVVNNRLVYPAELGKLNIKLTWDFKARVETNRVSVKKLNGEKFIDMGPSYVEVPILPLLTNRIALEKITINTLDADVTRFENGSFDIGTVIGKAQKPRYKVSVKNADILINGYKLKFTDKKIKPPKSYLFAGEKIRINDFTPNKYILADATGTAFLDDKAATEFNLSFSSALPFLKAKKFHLAGNIKNFDLGAATPYLEDKITLLGKGDINFDVEVYKKYFGKNKFFVDAVLNQFKAKTPKHGVFSEYPGHLNFLARGYYNDNLTVLDNLKIISNDINITSSGEVKKQDVNLKLKLEDSQIHSISKLFPKIVKVKKEPFKKVLKHGLKAIVSGQIKIKGNLKQPEMFGEIEYKNLSVLKNTPASYGKIDFIGHYLVLDNKIFVNKNSFANITGKISPFKYKTTDINITSTEMDFEKASRMMFIAHDFLVFKLGPVEKMDFKGNGKVNLNITGKFSNAKLNGYVEGKGLTVKYETLCCAAHDVTGRIVFDGTKAHYDELKGFVEGMRIIPTGYSTLKGYSNVVLHFPELELDKALNFVHTSPLLYSVQDALEEILKAGGKADTILRIKGTEDDVDSCGEFKFKDANILYKGFAAPFEKVNGELEFENENVYFKGMSGYALGEKAEITGFIKENQDAEFKVTADSITLKPTKDFVSNSPLLIKAAEVIDDYPEVSGKSDIEVNIKGNLEKDAFQSFIMKDMNGCFTNKFVGFPVCLNSGILTVTANKVDARNVAGIIQEIPFKTNGNVSNIRNFISKNEPLVPDFQFKSPKFDFSNFSQFIQAPITPPEIKQLFADFCEFHGIADVNINARPKEWQINIIPTNVSAMYKPYDTFILLNSGSAQISNKGANFSNLRGIISESLFVFNGFVEKNKFDLTSNFNVNSEDIEKFRFYTDIPLVANGIIPLTLSLKGEAKNWDFDGRMILEKGTFLSYFTPIGLPRNQLRLINIKAHGTQDRINIDRLGLDMDAKNLLTIYGAIDNIRSSKPVFKDFIVKTNQENPIKTNYFNTSIGSVLNNGCENFFSQGTLKADLKLNGYVVSPEIFGNVALQDLVIPDYQSHIDLINFNFNKNNTALNINNLVIGETSMNIQALMNGKIESPMVIKDLKISSPLLNIDEITKIIPAGLGKGPGELPPVIIANGTLNAGEMVLRNLITNNVKAGFSFTPDWLLSVPKISFTATNGVGQGSIFFNMKTTELSSNFKFTGMDANAVASTILSLPNEVYGTLDGSVQFSTRGKNSQELISNANGYAEFRIADGRFVRLGSLEYLLRAFNVLQSGVGGFNLNNIIDLIAPQKTGHFEVLKGSVTSKNGVIFADDIASRGKNLSLFMSGKLDMLTNQSDIQILGLLSKKVSGKLGPLGSISINQFIDYIPGLGFLPTAPQRKGVIDLIPGLSKIPGLELADDDEYRRFAVQINGDLYDPNSVRSFRWVE
ncbi:MAG: hypothetical protein A2Y25_04070 [Candidatus Melainabacteria bacterium GWF2_37_15]|nr:MAG: hypothetical protein A2Y25_04070 [Candidatus Melainabacteria bacterium GWF2_37_15]